MPEWVLEVTVVAVAEGTGMPLIVSSWSDASASASGSASVGADAIETIALRVIEQGIAVAAGASRDYHTASAEVDCLKMQTPQQC